MREIKAIEILKQEVKFDINFYEDCKKADKEDGHISGVNFKALKESIISKQILISIAERFTEFVNNINLDNEKKLAAKDKRIAELEEQLKAIEDGKDRCGDLEY